MTLSHGDSTINTDLVIIIIIIIIIITYLVVLVGRPFQKKAEGFVVSYRIGIKFGRIVFQVNMH